MTDTAASAAAALLNLADLPAALPPTSRLNILKTWWHRSDRSSEVSEARLLARMQFFSLSNRFETTGSAESSKTTARVGLVDLGDGARKINTLVIEQEGNDFVPSSNGKLTGAPGKDNEEGFLAETGYTPEAQTTLDLRTGVTDWIEPTEQKHNLVMCHGYGAGLGFFYRNYHTLSQVPGWRIYSIDWVGMGRSSRPKWTIHRKKGQSWEDITRQTETHFVESLEDWRKVQKIEKMTLMGHSLGGYLSACYALKYPERVERLILVSPAGVPEPPEDVEPPTPATPAKPATVSPSPSEPSLTEQAAEIRATTEAITATDPTSLPDEDEARGSKPYQLPPTDRPRARRIPGWATYLWNLNVTPMLIMRMSGPFGPSFINGYTSRRFAHLGEGEQHDLYDYLYHISSLPGSGEYALASILAPGAYARSPLVHRLEGIKMPTTFLYGQQDWMDYKGAEEAKKSMTVPTKILRIPQAGHHLYLDNPKEFNAAVVTEMMEVVAEARK